MSRARIASLLAFATATAVAGSAAESAPAQVSAGATSPILAAPSGPLPGPDAALARPRAISSTAAAQLAAAAPKFDAAVPKFDPAATAKPAELTPDLRETDKPRNTIVRLPRYVVQEEKPPVFKERELLTPQARVKLALAKHPGLHFGSFWIFNNDGIALAMLAEEERLEQKREFEDLAAMTRFSDPATHATVKREVERAFMREPDFGR
jgi:hypothetical protein